MNPDTFNALMIAFAVVYFLPIFLLGFNRPSLLGCMVVMFNLLALPALLLGGFGALLWILAFVLALIDRSTTRARRQIKATVTAPPGDIFDRIGRFVEGK